MAKVMVRFSLRVYDLTLEPEAQGAVLEWKRGKHSGSTDLSSVGEFLFPCTLSFHQKRKAFEEKELQLNVVQRRKNLGKARIAIGAMATELGDATERVFSHTFVLDSGPKLSLKAHLKRLMDPRERGMMTPSPNPSPTTSSGSAADDLSTPVNRNVSVPTMSVNRTRSGEIPTPAKSKSSPRSSQAESLEGSGYASAGGMPLRGHHRLGSNTPSSSASVASGAATSGGLSATPPAANVEHSPSSARTSKRLLGGHGVNAKGHRRGKSHAVTPDELRGLHAPLDLRELTGGASGPRKSGSKFPTGSPSTRTSSVGGASSPRASKLKMVSTDFLITNTSDSDSDEGSTTTSPRAAGGGLTSSGGIKIRGRSPHQRSKSGQPPGESMGASGGLAEWLDDAFSPPARIPSSPMTPKTADHSPMPLRSSANSADGGEEVAFYKRQLAEQNRRRDETFIFHTFVAFGEPLYSDEISVGAYVFFMCLREWDSFRAEGRDFREQLLTGLDKLSRTADATNTLYWLSTVTSLLHLLRSRYPPVPRSEVAKANTLVVFQERLRGLSSVFFARAVSLTLEQLRSPLRISILEQHSLEDVAGPSPARGKGLTRKNSLVRPTIATVVRLLDALKGDLQSHKVASSIASQLFAHLSQGMVAVVLNALLTDGNKRLCTFSNGLQMKKPVSELRSWFQRHQFEQGANHLAPLEETVNVLCMNKSVLVEPDVRKEVCPNLTPAQLGQLLLNYTPDEFDSEPVSPIIVSQASGGLRQPFDFRMPEQPPLLLALDMTEVSFTLSSVSLPKPVIEQPSLAFLTQGLRSSADVW